MIRRTLQPLALASAALAVGSMSACRTGLFDNNDPRWRVPESRLKRIDGLDPQAASSAAPVPLEEAARR